MRNRECNGVRDCQVYDDEDCEVEMYSCDYNSTHRIHGSRVCDGLCDCADCKDESTCYGEGERSVGLWCNSTISGVRTLIPDTDICDQLTVCMGGEDEVGCGDDSVGWCMYLWNRTLTEQHKCSPQTSLRICGDGRDYVNCTRPEDRVLTCTMEGYTVTLSRLALCRNYSLCDDGYENLCEEVEPGCVVHRGEMCDGVWNCPYGTDEVGCSEVLQDHSCRMRMGGTRPILKKLVNDGVVDCIGGIDEGVMATCGNYPWNFDVANKPDECREMLKCEGEVGCARRVLPFRFHILSTVLTERSGYMSPMCIRGIRHLRFQLGVEDWCVIMHLEILPRTDFQMTEQFVMIQPHEQLFTNPHLAYSLHYIMLSCRDDNNLTCPVLPLPRWTCSNEMERHVLSISDNNEITSLLRTSNTPGNAHYTRMIFPCKNGRCIPLYQVCDVLNDCLDGSDETHCENGYLCPGTATYRIPLTALCDGIIDCPGRQDECGCQGDYDVVTMVTMGSIQVLVTVTGWGFRRFRHHPLDTTFLLGAFCTGLHLTALGGFQFGPADPCKRSHPWTSTKMCWFLSAIHSTGSVMTVLSLTARSVLIRDCRKLVLIGLQVVVTMVAILVAVLPLVVHSDDLISRVYISNTAELHRTLDKREITVMVRRVMGRIREARSWETLKPILKSLFTNRYGDVEFFSEHPGSNCQFVSDTMVTMVTTGGVILPMLLVATCTSLYKAKKCLCLRGLLLGCYYCYTLVAKLLQVDGWWGIVVFGPITICLNVVALLLEILQSRFQKRKGQISPSNDIPLVVMGGASHEVTEEDDSNDIGGPDCVVDREKGGHCAGKRERDRQSWLVTKSPLILPTGALAWWGNFITNSHGKFLQ
eukprot:sb/3461978/